jgi:hypothetical protein
MQVSDPKNVLRRYAGMSAFLVTTAIFVGPAAACDFEPVKKQIDIVLGQDKEKSERFRREVAAGSDSLTVLGRLVSDEWREKIDICRFYAAEYLAKRGFPPAH